MTGERRVCLSSLYAENMVGGEGRMSDEQKQPEEMKEKEQEKVAEEEKEQETKEAPGEIEETMEKESEEIEESPEEQEKSESETEALKEEIASLTKEVEEWKNRYLRAQADMENLRRRTKEEKEKALKYSTQDLMESLLPVIDNFERALNVEVKSEEASSLLKGVNMVYEQLLSALKKEGMEVIPALGETFDPHVHQAVMQVEEEEFASGEIVEELQKGYKLKDRVLRPSMVKVNA